MGHIKESSKGESSSSAGLANVLVPKPETFDFDYTSDALYLTQHGDNVASSSRGNLRSFLTGMGFLPSLVDKVIEENGEENVDLLLEILIGGSDLQKSNPQSSKSLASLFEDKNESCPPEYSAFIEPKEEPDFFDTADLDYDKRASLLNMNFSVNEVEFAINKLGEDAPVDEIVDFITAAQIAENVDQEVESNMSDSDIEINKGSNDETLFGTMDKTLQLLELGFSENEVSLAIERLGTEVPITELADLICGDQVGEVYVKKEKCSFEDSSATHSNVAINSKSFSMGQKNNRGDCSSSSVKIKSRDASSRSRDSKLEEARKGKRPKEEDIEVCVDAPIEDIGFEENYRGKRPKEECDDDFCPYFETTWEEEKVEPDITGFGMFEGFKSSSCRSLDSMVARPPYFFYGNVVTTSVDTWGKISQFLYAIKPEFVNTRFFSALNRKEGYIHNLPIDNRFHILPKPPMTLEEALPHTKKWWPSWDTRKQLSSFSLGTTGVSKLCDKFAKMLNERFGSISTELKRQILYHCQKFNLMWVGPHKLGPIEPDHLELILGYPMNHSQVAEINLQGRLRSLNECFQIDTLGYHLSVLKSMFPEGITVLSIFSGIGGAEVTLDRLGILLKAVVSVETSEVNRRILKNWWNCSRQTGQLEQIDDIQKLSSSKIERLIEKLGGFDFIICQSSCSHSSKGPKPGLPEDDSPPSFDFTPFHEFVRVVQRVRSTMGRQR